VTGLTAVVRYQASLTLADKGFRCKRKLLFP
jgi:hypothetical protein